MTEAAVLPRGDAVAQMSTTVPSDGRNRRAAETRRKIIEAAKAMIAETSEAPTVVGVARRADVSVRSVFQHFGDVESLFVTVVDSVKDDIVVPPPPPATGPLAERIDTVVRNLAEVFDRIVPLRVAAGHFPSHPALVDRSRFLKQQLRETALEVFAPEFAALGPETREELADAVGAALSLDAWVVLRRRDGLGLERAVAVWRRTLTALMEHGLAASAVK
ncbi:MAG: TetR/AcrR family transcriptional regulator [Enhydrobacter sp.]|nr:MAG: TetR/AcrR family transcriptional regulator [Enhydrobacter sp.]